MARGVELSTAYVSIAAETSQLSKGIGAAFKGADKVASKAGKSMGKAVSDAYAKEKGPDFDKLRADAEKADKAVAASAERGAKARESAARAVEIAEARVQEVRERSIRQDARVKDAEKALNDARKSGDAEAVARAEKALGDARENAKPTSADMAAEDRLVKARDGLVLATQKAEGELKGYQDAQEKANLALREAKSASDDAERSTEKAGNAFQRLGDRVQAALKGDFKGAFKGVDLEAQKSADNTVEEFDDAGDDAGGGMLDGLKGALLGVGGAFGIGASFGELFQQGMESVSSKSKLKASLGLSDKDAAELGKDAVGAYKNGWGEDLASTTDVTAAASMYLGSGVDTQWATEMSIAMSEAFGTDPQENIKAVAQMIRTGMVKDAKEGFDVLTKGYQSGADKAGDLTDTMTEYGTQFRNLGINGADAIGLMSQGLNLGARDADKVADAFKEFGIRAVDGSDLTAQSFAALGLDADDMAARIGAGGQTARDATQEVLERLGAVEDPATRAQIAVGLFGTQAEDLGSALYGLDLDTAASGMGEVAGSTQTMADALSEAQSPFDRIKRSFADIGTSLGSGMLPALNLFADLIIGVGEFFRANPLVFGIVAAGLTAIGVALAIMTAPTIAASFAASGLGVALASVSWPVLAIIAGITLLVAALTWFFTQTEVGKAILAAVVDWMVNTAWPMIKQFGEWIAAAGVWLWQTVLKPVWEGIKATIGAVVDWMVNTAWPGIKAAWDAIAGAAQWLYQSVIKPVWSGISAAISATVDWIMGTAVPLIKAAWDLIAGSAKWLWGVFVAVWNGIKGAVQVVVSWFHTWVWPVLEMVIKLIQIGFNGLKSALQAVWNFIRDGVIKPVVLWFQNTAWPLIRTVIEAIKLGFNVMRDSLKAAWQFVKDRVISPVVNWFKNVAWPILRGAIDSVKTGFNTMRDSIKNAWNFVKDRVISPVANWFRDAIKPLFDRTTDGIGNAFDSMKNTIKTAWEAVKTTAKAPIKFVVETVLNNALIGNFNKLARKLGTSELPSMSLPRGFARGGVLPGMSRMRDGDDQLVPMRRGEGVLVSEGLRTREDRQAFLAANAAGRRGIGFASLMQGGFAGGGILGSAWDGIKGVGRSAKDLAGDALDKVLDGVDFVAEALKDPSSIFKKVYDAAMGAMPGVGDMVSLAKGAGSKLLSGVIEKAQSLIAPTPDAPAGPAQAGGSLGIAQALARQYGLTMTSSRRPGARTAGSGSVSLHAQGRAMDFSNSSGPTPQMMAFFNAMHPFRPTELLYSPAGGRQWRRGGRMADTSGATKRGHYNHVHVGFAGGGILGGKPFLHDNGGWHEPGKLSINQTRKPEAVLTNAQWRTMQSLAEQNLVGDGQTIVQVHAPSTEDPGTWGRRVAESLDLHRLAATAGGI